MNEAAGPNALDELLDEVVRLAVGLRQTSYKGEHSAHVSAAEARVLQVIGRQGGQPVPQIARVRTTSRQNIQMLVNKLKAAGYVEIKANPAHRRSSIVCLTEQGSAILAGSELATSNMKRDLQPVDDLELAMAISVLRRVREHLTGRTEASLQTDHPRTELERREKTLAGSSKLAGQASKGNSTQTPSGLSEPEVEESELPVSLL